MPEKFEGLVLALDIASCTGWASGRPGQIPRFGSIRFGKPGTPRDASYRMFRMWVDETLTSLEPNLVVFESAAVATAMGGKTNIETMKKLIGLNEHLEEICYQRVELREANVRQVRAFFLGGAAQKREQAKAATIEKCKSYGWNVENDDEADACALLAYQISCLRPDLAQQFTPMFYGATGKISQEW